MGVPCYSFVPGIPFANGAAWTSSHSCWSPPVCSVSRCATGASIGSKRSDPMIALLIVSILLFAYMCYVLVKPEKF
ncbi:MAG: K(+)-transporting ATPase subunit F [Flavobacteriales bacterium]|nr:K(+)-transporting ATPase subunit F [Flavobacteriales bacterium]MBK9286359.1 K(+)-transporting ATPase subunit F [Flavobacteriales bacterium]